MLEHRICDVEYIFQLGYNCFGFYEFSLFNRGWHTFAVDDVFQRSELFPFPGEALFYYFLVDHAECRFHSIRGYWLGC